jgi:hypothetical protein
MVLNYCDFVFNSLKDNNLFQNITTFLNFSTTDFQVVEKVGNLSL